MRLRNTFCILLAVVLISAGAWAQYTVKDLGTLGGVEAYCQDINDSGQVVGAAANAAGKLVPFLWSQSAGMKCLGTVPGATRPEGCATTINNVGQIAGWSYNNKGVVHPFRWSQTGGMVDLGSAYAAWGINSAGTIVGETATVNNVNMGFVWTLEAGMRTIGMYSPASLNAAYKINSSNLTVGFTKTKTGVARPVVWIGAYNMKYLNLLTNSPAGTSGTAYGVNTKGEVVGVCGTHAVLWNPYFYIKDLGTLKSGGTSRAYDINDQSIVVGTCTVPGSTARKYAFVWSVTKGMRELTVPTTLKNPEATAINLAGQIAGTALDLKGKRHAIVWIPATR